MHHVAFGFILMLADRIKIGSKGIFGTPENTKNHIKKVGADLK